MKMEKMEECVQRLKKSLNEFFDKLKDNPEFAKKIFWLILGIMVILPWVMLLGIRGLNAIFQCKTENSGSCIEKLLGFVNALFNLGKDGISTWFTFWGSYVGAIVTYLLTAFTIRLSFISEKRAEKESLDQLAFQLGQLDVEKVYLCDLEEHYPVRELELFQERVGYKYLVKIVFKNPFPAYFRLYSQKKIAFDEKEIQYDSGEELPAYHINGDNFEILYLISEKSGLFMNIRKFYYINYYEQSVMSTKERTKHLGITFWFENTLYDNKVKEKNVYRMSVDIKVENKDTYQKQWVELNVLDRMLEGKKE